MTKNLHFTNSQNCLEFELFLDSPYLSVLHNITASTCGAFIVIVRAGFSVIMILQHDMLPHSELKAILGVAVSSLSSLDLSSLVQLSAGRISVL
jgi:hypothetical protein